LDFILLFFIHVTSEVGTHAVQSNEDVVNCKISIKIYYVFLQLSIVQTEKVDVGFFNSCLNNDNKENCNDKKLGCCAAISIMC
jgi:hypothetical protein